MAGDQTVSVGIPTPDALMLLPLPEMYLMTQQMLEGRMCVWGGEMVETVTSVRLGDRTVDGRRIFPRACPRCLAVAARRARIVHADDCQPCRSETTTCETGRAFRRIEAGTR